MNHVHAWAISLTLIFPQSATAGDAKMPIEHKAVLETIQTMTSAFQNGDIDAVMRTYEDGATVVFEPGAPVEDRQQLSQMFAMMSNLNPEFDYAGHEVIVNGDIAVHIAPWSMTGTTAEGQAIAQSGLSVAVLRQQSDGSWRMVIDNPHGQRLMP